MVRELQDLSSEDRSSIRLVIMLNAESLLKLKQADDVLQALLNKKVVQEGDSIVVDGKTYVLQDTLKGQNAGWRPVHFARLTFRER